MGSGCVALVDCFIQSTLRCTLLARWDEGYADPRLLLTDLAPQAALCGVVQYAHVDRGRLQGYQECDDGSGTKPR